MSFRKVSFEKLRISKNLYFNEKLMNISKRFNFPNEKKVKQLTNSYVFVLFLFTCVQ